MQNVDNASANLRDTEAATAPKKAYVAPTLTVHGSVAELTAGTGSCSGDAGNRKARQPGATQC